MAEINEKKRHNPSILELKPNTHLGYPPSTSSNHHHHHHHHQGSNQAYQPLKFRPTAEIKDFKPSYQLHKDHHGEFTVGAGAKPAQQTYKPGTVLTVKKPEVKKIRLITPGLKHYASVPKYVSRNDYANYFRSRMAQEEQHDASKRMVQNMYKRNPRALLTPQYAPEALNYFNL